MPEDILSVVRSPLPLNLDTLRDYLGRLREFELSHPSPISTHYERDGDGMIINYHFKNPRDALCFGKMIGSLTTVSYQSNVDLLLQRINPSLTS